MGLENVSNSLKMINDYLLFGLIWFTFAPIFIYPPSGAIKCKIFNEDFNNFSSSIDLNFSTKPCGFFTLILLGEINEIYDWLTLFSYSSFE